MRSYLIVGNQTLMGPELAAAIAERMVPGDPPDFYVVVPATPKPGALHLGRGRGQCGRAGAPRRVARPPP